jgi:hypothetical protein
MLHRILEFGEKKICYVALEPEHNLVEESILKLKELQFQEISPGIYSRKNMIIQLMAEDFFTFSTDLHFDLMIGCCFADLFMPDILVSNLLRISKGSLVYLPITFSGSTKMVPKFLGNGETPSDDIVEDAYSKCLVDQGQNLQYQLIVEKFQEIEGVLVAEGPSNWRIDPNNKDHRYFWEAMLYFIGLGVTGRLSPTWNVKSWLQYHRKHLSSFNISNVDLLLKLPC